MTVMLCRLQLLVASPPAQNSAGMLCFPLTLLPKLMEKSVFRKPGSSLLFVFYFPNVIACLQPILANITVGRRKPFRRLHVAKRQMESSILLAKVIKAGLQRQLRPGRKKEIIQVRGPRHK